MKKRLLGIFVALFLCLSASTAYAAENIAIKIDGQNITSDVKPEIKNNRVMVPVRVISEHLGAHVKYADGTVNIVRGDLSITLSLNSAIAKVDGKRVQLDAKPYAKDNRIFVPLRFIAEVFESKVGYAKGTVTVNTPPLVVEGKAIKALQWEFRMTMGGMIQQSTGNIVNESIYQILMNNIGDEVEAPEHYSWMYMMDSVGAYHQYAQYDFFDAKGNAIASYGVYALVTSVPAELIEGYPSTLIHDGKSGKWYLFEKKAANEMNELLIKAQQSGHLILVSNTIV